MGMAGGDDPMGTGPGGSIERRAEDPPRRADLDRSARGEQRIEGALERAQQHRPPLLGRIERAHQGVEDVEVVDQRLGVRIDEDELGSVEPVQRRVAGGLRRAHRRGSELGERRIGGGLDEQAQRTGEGVDGDGLPTWVEPLQRSAIVLVADQAFALEPRCVEPEPEVDQRFHPLSGPGCRDLAAEPEPGRRPRRPPAPADLERGERVRGRPGGDDQRASLGVDEGKDPLAELSPDPFLDQQAVIVHPASVARPGVAGGGAELDVVRGS